MRVKYRILLHLYNIAVDKINASQNKPKSKRETLTKEEEIIAKGG